MPIIKFGYQAGYAINAYQSNHWLSSWLYATGALIQISLGLLVMKQQCSFKFHWS
jgi:hypothetical protein